MTKQFATSLKVPYRGAVSPTRIQYCGDANAVPFVFPWRTYGTYIGSGRATAVNPGVQFSLANPPSQVLKTVQGVFIDNTDVSSPVYFRCVDTGHTVACADNATAYFPILTNGADFELYIESVDGPFQANQQTTVYILDRALPPYAGQQASNRFVSLAQVSGQEQFSSIIIADNVASNTFNSGANSVTVGQLLSVASNRTYVIRDIFGSINAVEFGNGGTRASGTIQLNLETGNGQTLVSVGGGAVPAYVENSVVGAASPGSFINLNGLALRVKGSDGLRFRAITSTSGSTATWNVTIGVTYANLANPTT